MRQVDFHVGAIRSQRNKFVVMSCAVFVCHASRMLVGVRLEEALKKNEIVNYLAARKREIHGTSFNLNIFAESEGITKYKFKKEHNGIIQDAVNWNLTQTCWDSYTIDSTDAFCIVVYS